MDLCKFAFGLVPGHVYRHGYRHVHEHAMVMCTDMCTVLYAKSIVLGIRTRVQTRAQQEMHTQCVQARAQTCTDVRTDVQACHMSTLVSHRDASCPTLSNRARGDVFWACVGTCTTDVMVRTVAMEPFLVVLQ